MTREWERKLNIQTQHIRKWPQGIYDYHQSEGTEYPVLEEVFGSLIIREEDCLVDFGCGSGRVIFFAHYLYQIKVKGIELHPEVYLDLENNLITYSQISKGAINDIAILHGYAQEYPIQREDSIFYFFNPFTLSIMKEVILKIIKSIESYPRFVQVIIYYPDRKTEDFLNSLKQMSLKHKIITDPKDYRGYLLIYHYKEAWE